MIAIIAATLSEIKSIICKMKISKQASASLPFCFEGSLGNSSIVIVMSGIGKENALRATRFLMKSYSFESVLSIGVAGAVSRDLEIGDIILGRHIMCLDISNVAVSSDRALLDITVEACKALNNRCYIGDILTVPKFIGHSEDKARIYLKYRVLGVDLESFYIAREMYQVKIPFLSMRVVSDTASQSINVNYEAIRGGVVKRSIFFINHPSSYGAYRKLNMNITRAASHLLPIVEILLKRM